MPGGRQNRLVAGAGDLEEDLVLALELDLLVVDAARQEHGAVRADELVARKAGGALALGASLSGHAGNGVGCGEGYGSMVR